MYNLTTFNEIPPSSSKSLLSLLFISILSLGMTGCSSKTDIESNLGIDDAPEWVNEGTHAVDDADGQLLQGVGMAAPINDLSLQKSTADNRARAEIARVLSTFMNSSMQDYSANNNDMGSMNIEREINSLSQTSLNGAKIIARWKNEETGDIYSFAELNLDQVESLVEKSNTMNADYKAYFNQHINAEFKRFVKMAPQEK